MRGYIQRAEKGQTHTHTVTMSPILVRYTPGVWARIQSMQDWIEATMDAHMH